jgi:hypothetical protein
VHVCHVVPVRHPRQISPPPDYQAALFEQGEHWLLEVTPVMSAMAPPNALSVLMPDVLVPYLRFREINPDGTFSR